MIELCSCTVQQVQYITNTTYIGRRVVNSRAEQSSLLVIICLIGYTVLLDVVTERAVETIGSKNIYFISVDVHK